MKYCSNCGKELQEGAEVCLNCGKLIKRNVEEQKERKKGSNIASMVLGIIAIFWSLSALSNIEAGVITLVRELKNEYSLIYFIFYYIGYTLFALTPGIISLVLGIKSYKLSHSKMSMSGIIMSFIALFSCLYIFVRFIAVIFLNI